MRTSTSSIGIASDRFPTHGFAVRAGNHLLLGAGKTSEGIENTSLIEGLKRQKARKMYLPCFLPCLQGTPPPEPGNPDGGQRISETVSPVAIWPSRRPRPTSSTASGSPWRWPITTRPASSNHHRGRARNTGGQKP